MQKINQNPLIEVKDVSKTYVSKKGELVNAIGEVSFDIHEGEFVSVVGPSGCGKTTLLMLVSGLLPPTKGKIILKGKTLIKPQPDIGIVFQAPVLFRWRTVIKNVMLPVEVRKLDEKEYYKTAEDLIRLVGLKGFEECYPRELSGGMQQRISICRALIQNPSLLLMDEPFGALDALTRDEMNLELQRIWMKTRKTVMFVTHYIPEAVFLSDRVIVMSRRPSKITKIAKINLPRPRTWGVKTSLRYRRYVESILKSIRKTTTEKSQGEKTKGNKV